MSRNDYINRINRVIDYIEANLAKEMTLDELADVAAFSPFHFHRIFTAFMDESLSHFIKRLRLEKAAAMLCSGEQPVTDIALDCGFSSSSVFARSFKEFFGISATEWRIRKNCKDDSNGGKAHSKNREDLLSSESYNLIKNNRRKQMNVVAEQVEVKDLEEMSVAYVRYVGPYAGDEKLFENLYSRLFKWAGPRGLLNFPETMAISVYHDDPNLTDEDKLRTSICITVPEDTAVSGDIGLMKIPGGKYAMARFEISPDQYGDAWNYVCGEWLPDSGWTPGEGMNFEISLNDPKEHPEGKHIVAICIPVKPE